jgi:hypothetical protein
MNVSSAVIRIFENGTVVLNKKYVSVTIARNKKKMESYIYARGYHALNAGKSGFDL